MAVIFLLNDFTDRNKVWMWLLIVCTHLDKEWLGADEYMRTVAVNTIRVVSVAG